MGNTMALAEEGAATVYEEAEQPEQSKELADAESLEQEQKEIGGAEEEGSEESHEEGSELTGGKKEEEEEEEEPPKVTVDDVKTAPMDWRFPTVNQAKHCYTRYNEYHKCIADKGEDAPECAKYQRYYRSLCPGEWIDKWNEQRDAGTFAGRY